MLPGALLYTYLGAAGKASLGSSAKSPLEWAFLALGLIATLAVTIWVSRIAKNALSNNPNPAINAQVGKPSRDASP